MKKVTLISTLVVLLLLIGSLSAYFMLTPSQNHSFKHKENDYLTRNNTQYFIASYLEKHIPHLKTANNYQKAVLLRDFVYQHTTVGVSPISILPITKNKWYRWLDGSIKMVCSGMALQYGALLDLYHIPNRLVSLQSQMAFAKKSFLDTHVTVAIESNGRWIVMDPTFNIHWRLHEKSLGIYQLRNAFLDGSNPIPVTDGMKTQPNRTVKAYYLPYQDLLAHIDVVNITSWGANTGTQATISHKTDPVSWRYRQLVPLQFNFDCFILS